MNNEAGTVIDRLSKRRLADELGISRVTLDRYLNMDGAPGPDGDARYSVEDVATFIGQIKDAPKKTGEAFWKSEKVRLQCEAIAFDLQVKKAKFIGKEEASRTIIPLMAELGELLTKEFELVNPTRYKGRDQVECAAINRKSVDLVISRFRRGAQPFTE